MNKKLEYSSLIKKLISCESREQLSDVIKEINEFNKEYSITSRSEEFKKFEIVIGVMRVKLKRKHDIIENQLRGQKQNNKPNMKIIITERQYKLLEMDSSVRRRLKGVEFFITVLLGVRKLVSLQLLLCSFSGGHSLGLCRCASVRPCSCFSW